MRLRRGIVPTVLMLLVLFLLAFAIRAVAPSVLPGLELAVDYKKWYSPMALSILNGNGFSVTPGQPAYQIVPLYPLFLAAVYAIFGTDANIRIALALLGGISCILVYLTAKRVFGSKVAVLSALAFAIYPPLVLLPSTGISDDLYILLNLGFTLYVVKFFQAPSWRNSITGGILMGLAGLTKPGTILFPLVLLIAFTIYAWRRLSLRQQAKFAGLVLAFLVTIFPWSLRNYLVFHEVFILSVSPITLGDHLFIGTLESQLASAPYDERVSQYWQEWRKVIKEEAGREVSDKQEQGYVLTTVVAKKILGEPLEFLRLLPKKFLRFWYASDSGRWDTIFMFLQGGVLLLSVVGMVLFLRSEGWRQAFPLFPILIYYPVLHTLSLPLARYSMPIMPLVMMFSAYAVARLFDASKAYAAKRAKVAVQRRPVGRR